MEYYISYFDIKAKFYINNIYCLSHWFYLKIESEFQHFVKVLTQEMIFENRISNIHH
jgi:hypothetical protein